MGYCISTLSIRKESTGRTGNLTTYNETVGFSLKNINFAVFLS